MANISDKTNLTNHTGVVNEAGVAGANWISQINAGGTVYDIATHHGITFVEGNNGAKTVWNGLTDLEVVIPSIQDIVQTPIEFAGTVGADGKITWVNGHSEAEAGSLVFITENCTFDEKPCEKGDMAIYDGTKWYTVSGEHQIDILGTADNNNKVTVAVGSAKDVLTVEGKTLTLSLDYAELDKHVSLSKGKVTDVVFDTMTVGSVDIKLNKADDVPTEIGVAKEFQKATALKDGTVTLTGATGLVNGIEWGTFDAGTATTSQGNSEQNLIVTGGNLDLTSKQATGDFVDSVKINAVTFADATLGEAGSIHMVTDIVAGKGQSFVNGIALTKEGETADLTIKGYMTTEKVGVKFIEAWSDSTLAPVTSITKGGIELDANGTDFVTGFGTESTSAGDVVSSVTVTYNNNTSVLDSAKVENHVLSFGSTNVTSNVSYGCGYKSLTKGSYKYTAPEATTTAFVSSGFTNVDDVKYTFGKAQETTYTTTTDDWKLNTPELTVTYGGYGFNDDGMKANVPANTFIASVTAGNLPSWTGYDFTTTNVTGTVSTELTTEKFEFNALKSINVNMPGAYTLSTVDAGAGDITVGKEGALAANTATVDLSTYLTGVAISETVVR